MSDHMKNACEPLSSPFTAAPSEYLIRRARGILVPDGFSGRAGILTARSTDGEEILVKTAFEEMTRGRADSYLELSERDLWPSLPNESIPTDLSIVTGKGERVALRAFFEELFKDYPDRPWYQGGKELEERRAQWRFAVIDALGSPCVKLLNEFNAANAELPRDSRFAIEGIAEWWAGESPAHEVRHSGTFIPPRSSAKFLIEKLLEGIPHTGELPLVRNEAREVPVLYEDDEIVVINKPARLASVPGVREKISAKSILEKTRGPLRVVHRLDLDTSGVLLYAKTAEAERTLHRTFREGNAFKRYEARLEGVPREKRGRISLPMAVNRLDRPRQCILPVGKGGKESITDWELTDILTMKNGRRAAIVSLWPETGRTHQLRIHCAHREGLGLPIEGDPFYGRLGLLAEKGTTRLCLHAAELTIEHPVTGEVMTFSAPSEFPDFDMSSKADL